MLPRGWPAFACLVTACAAEPPRSRVAEPNSPCIRWETESRYRPYGYDHIVHIHNGCTAVATCAVTTDVNPEATQAVVPARGTVEVVTWVGAPAPAFTASVSCVLHSAH